MTWDRADLLDTLYRLRDTRELEKNYHTYLRWFMQDRQKQGVPVVNAYKSALVRAITPMEVWN